mmetsp:Transcript_5694/g.17167  ORF Transcript_5694/g.17167 Transcript_5694/m.17167 type:complete len:294 (+) Transcript_5694:862-1743(+)
MSPTTMSSPPTSATRSASSARSPSAASASSSSGRARSPPSTRLASTPPTRAASSSASTPSTTDPPRSISSSATPPRPRKTSAGCPRLPSSNSPKGWSTPTWTSSRASSPRRSPKHPTLSRDIASTSCTRASSALRVASFSPFDRSLFSSSRCMGCCCCLSPRNRQRALPVLPLRLRRCSRRIERIRPSLIGLSRLDPRYQRRPPESALPSSPHSLLQDPLDKSPLPLTTPRCLPLRVKLVTWLTQRRGGRRAFVVGRVVWCSPRRQQGSAREYVKLLSAAGKRLSAVVHHVYT